MRACFPLRSLPPNTGGSQAFACLCARIAVRYFGVDTEIVRAWAGIKGGTALANAAAHGSLSVCRQLLDAKADPQIKDALGHTPLNHARYRVTGKLKNGTAPLLIEELLLGQWDSSLLLCNTQGSIFFRTAEERKQESRTARRGNSIANLELSFGRTSRAGKKGKTSEVTADERGRLAP